MNVPQAVNPLPNAAAQPGWGKGSCGSPALAGLGPRGEKKGAEAASTGGRRGSCRAAGRARQRRRTLRKRSVRIAAAPG